MDKENKSVTFSGTIVIITFVVVCLTLMSVLSFTTANADYKLTKKAESKITDYYNIHGQAEEMLSKILDIIMSLNNNLDLKSDSNTIYKENYILMLENKLKELNEASIVYKDYSESYFLINYEIKGNENQKINVQLKIDYPIDDSLNYKIVSWSLSSIELPAYTEEINLWEGIDIDENY